MKSRSLLRPFLLFFLISGLVYAQSPAKPDLSGTWKLNLAKTKLTNGVKVEPETIIITCSGVSIQMRSMMGGRDSTQTYVADGKERTTHEAEGGEVVSKAYWKGSILLTETITRLKRPNNPTIDILNFGRTKERWKLSRDGRVLTMEVDDPKAVLVYDKQ